MSPWWAEPLLLQLTATRLTVGGRGVALSGPLPEALQTLPPDLLPRGRRIRVVLDDALLRYALIRWPDGLGRGPERAAFVAHRMKEVHGIAAPEWCWQVDPEPAPRPALACAAPEVLVEGLGALIRGRGCRLVAMTGAFAHRYNQGRPGFAAPLGALLVEGADRFTLGVWQGGAWQAVRSQPASVDRASALGLLLGTAGVAGAGTLYVAGPACAAPAGWQVQPLVLGGAA